MKKILHLQMLLCSKKLRPLSNAIFIPYFLGSILFGCSCKDNDENKVILPDETPVFAMGLHEDGGDENLLVKIGNDAETDTVVSLIPLDDMWHYVEAFVIIDGIDKKIQKKLHCG